MTINRRLPWKELRWRFDESSLGFKSTAEVNPAEGIVGQPVAMEAMRFGVESIAPAQNIYVRGSSGTGRMTLVHSLLEQLKPKARRRLDRCYVHNFVKPDRPRLLTLPAGQGPVLRRRMKDLADFIESGLKESLAGETMKARRDSIRKKTQSEVLEITRPLEDDLKANELALVNLQSGHMTRTVIFPIFEGKPVPPEEWPQMLQDEKITQQQLEAIQEKILQFSDRLHKTSREASKAMALGMQALKELNEREAREILQATVDDIEKSVPGDGVGEYLGEVIDDVVENRINRAEHQNSQGGLPPAQMVYGVNVLCSQSDQSSPVVLENTPNVANLLGTVEPEFLGNGQVVSNYGGIRAGALVNADGGYLILDAHDVLSEPGAWRLLMRAMRTGSVEIVPAELGWPMTTQSLKPEPIQISVRIILIGGTGLYYQLDQFDQDFSNLFKVLADFNSEIERSLQGVDQYAGVVARMCRDESLQHFSAGGIAALAEHGARIAARRGKITARFGRIADIVREAAFLASKQGDELVSRDHITETVAPVCLPRGSRN
jgi:ATP-dependent Lon protease